VAFSKSSRIASYYNIEAQGLIVKDIQTGVRKQVNYPEDIGEV